MDTLKGQFLIAMPSMLDFNFFHTVTCMSEHTADGALGIVVNRVIPSLTAGSIFRELKIEYTETAAKIPLHIGGPVHDERNIYPPWSAVLLGGLYHDYTDLGHEQHHGSY